MTAGIRKLPRERRRGVARGAGALGLFVMLATLTPASLAPAAATDGAWRGTLKDFKGSMVKFTVKHDGKRIKDFNVHGTYGTLHCYGQVNSAHYDIPKAKIHGGHISGRYRHVAQGLVEKDWVQGTISGKHASGTTRSEFFQNGTDVCGTARKLHWKARAR